MRGRVLIPPRVQNDGEHHSRVARFSMTGSAQSHAISPHTSVQYESVLRMTYILYRRDERKSVASDFGKGNALRNVTLLEVEIVSPSRLSAAPRHMRKIPCKFRP